MSGLLQDLIGLRGTRAMQNTLAPSPQPGMLYVVTDEDIIEQWDKDTASWIFFANAASSPGVASYDYICIRDQKAQGTDGGTFTSGAWQKRDLNTEASDDGNHASIASSQITLEAGTYVVQISAPAFRVSNHQARLQDITHTATLLTGTSELNAAGSAAAGTRSHIAGKITLTETTVLELQHRCATTKTTDGFGAQCNLTTEVYSIVELWKQNF